MVISNQQKLSPDNVSNHEEFDCRDGNMMWIFGDSTNTNREFGQEKMDFSRLANRNKSTVNMI